MRTVEELAEWVRARGGVAHSTTVGAAGFTMHAMRAAVARGVLHRVRRSWLALPDCDAELRRAAAAGGRLTCLTEARRMGLWVPAHSELHLAVPPTGSRSDAPGLHLHWSKGPSPVAPAALTDPIINVLHHVARCVPAAEGLAVWESAIRLKKIDAAVLAGVHWRGESARALARIASHLSDSGIETQFLVLMRTIDVAVRQQVWVDGHPLDALIGEHLAVQLDGFAHHRAKDRRRDIRADARLMLRGFTVLRFDYFQVLFEPEFVISTVATAIAQGRHR